MGAFAFDLARAAPEISAPAPDRLIEGQPQFTSWNLTTAFGDKVYAGLWRSTPGAWRVVYEEWEYFTVRAGTGLFTPDDGAPIVLAPGVAVVIEPGTTGVFKVLETLTKDYVVVLP